MLPIRTILHPTDFSAHAEAGFHLACALARDYKARLVLVAVRRPTEVVYGEFGTVPPVPEEDVEEMRERLFDIRPDDPNVPVEYFFSEGHPATEIVRLATETNADLIVMGTHGRTGLPRLLMGSVAEEVMRRAPCPVVTVKRPFADAAAEREPATASAT
jgi:nucleotide-binding universal stress UspA family protein